MIYRICLYNKYPLCGSCYALMDVRKAYFVTLLIIRKLLNY